MSDPTFVDAFDWAVIRLATHGPAAKTQPRLIFGTVTLLTKDRPRPASSRDVDDWKIAHGKSGKVFFRRVVLSAKDAVRWYREAGTGQLLTPVPGLHSERIPQDGSALLPTTFEDDPQWPGLGVPLEKDLFSSTGSTGDPVPFKADNSSRIHRRFGDNSGFDLILSDPATLAFLKRRLHIDLGDYTEYLGSLALVVPNPVLRRIQSVLIPAKKAGEKEHVLFRAIPRPNQDLAQVKLTLFERRSNLLSRFETRDIAPNGIETISSTLPFRETGYAISHPVQGLLGFRQPTSFLRQVNVRVDVHSRQVSVASPLTNSPTSPSDNYDVMEIDEATTRAIGAAPPGVTSRVPAAEFRRKRRGAAKRYKQTWFDNGQRSKANAFIRAEISRALTSVTVVDPYFGAVQIGQFLHAAPRTHIELTILTSKLAFEIDFGDSANQNAADVDAPAARAKKSTFEARKRQLDAFTDGLASLRNRGFKNVNALVVGGRTHSLHDRFLVVDDEVLFLGNSLNALGQQASLIVALPDSEPVIAKLRSMATKAERFEAYAKRRGKAKPRPAGS